MTLGDPMTNSMHPMSLYVLWGYGVFFMGVFLFTMNTLLTYHRQKKALGKVSVTLKKKAPPRSKDIESNKDWEKHA